jgi:hypothetical protein
MRIFKKIVLHPKLENEHRDRVENWCSQYIYKENWWINSNYDDHGCFNVTITGQEHESATTLFMLTFPDTQVLETEYTEIWGPSEESLNLFEGLK